MDMQQAFNLAIGVVGVLFGWVLKFFYDDLKSLQITNKELNGHIQGIKVLVAGEYVKKSAFDDMGKAVMLKLDRIEDKLDRKVDK